MDKLVKTKIYDLSSFLKDNNVVYEKIDIESGSAKLCLDSNIIITNRSGLYAIYDKFNLTSNIFKRVIELIIEINISIEFSEKSLWVEKAKLNKLLVNIDRSFTDKSFIVKFSANRSFGGYTKSRREICLYDPKSENVSEYLKIVPGINYHELGHVFFTPSWKKIISSLTDKNKIYVTDISKLYNDNIVKGLATLANVFEDPRIENLMCKKIKGCTEYFRTTVLEFLLSTIVEKVNAGEKVTELDCVLIAGRKYIDGKIRRWVFQEYIKSNGVDNAKAVRVNSYINKFITLSWRYDREEMLDLVIGFFYEFLKKDFEEKLQQYKNFSDIIKQLIGSMSTDENTISENDSDDNLSDDEQELLKKILKDLAAEGVEVPPSKGTGKKGKKDKSDGKSEKGKGKNKDKSDTIEDDTCHEKKPERSSDGNDIPGSEVKTIAEELLKNDENQINLRSADIKNKLKTTIIDHDENLHYKEYVVNVDMRKQKNKLEAYFKELKSYCRNGYKTKTRTGSVDIGEARRTEWKRGVKIFRRYKRNVEKALDIDVAFVLDCSHSMSGSNSKLSISKIHQSSRQLWIASEACRSVGAKVETFTFSTNDLGVLPPPKNTNTYNVPMYVGDTNIAETLYYAENYLAGSKYNTKWLICLTDGEINDISDHNSIIERMKSNGVTCGKINLTANRWEGVPQSDIYDHSLYMIHGDDTGDNIVGFFKNIYDISLRKVIGHQ